MTTDTSGVDRALGAIGTTFRLTRLYPPTHPAVQEALRQVGEALPPLAAVGTVEWKVGATGLHWHGQQLLPRNTQIAELAGLLYARGVRTLTLNPGMTADHVLALFQVATGTATPDAQTLGRITLTLGRGGPPGPERRRPPTPAEGVPAVADPASGAVPTASAATPQSAAAADTLMAAKRPSAAFRPDALPPDVAAARAVAAVRAATGPEEQRAAVERLAAVAPPLLGLREVATSADAIAALDHLLSAARDPGLLAAIDAAAVALSDRALVERMVRRLGEPHVPAEEREALVTAGGGAASPPLGPGPGGFPPAPGGPRAPLPAAVRKAADRAVEVLQGRLADKEPEVGAAAAEFVGLTGSPQAVTLLVPLLHHPSEFAREAALVGLAGAGGRGAARPARPAP